MLGCGRTSTPSEGHITAGRKSCQRRSTVLGESAHPSYGFEQNVVQLVGQSPEKGPIEIERQVLVEDVVDLRKPFRGGQGMSHAQC